MLHVFSPPRRLSGVPLRSAALFMALVFGAALAVPGSALAKSKKSPKAEGSSAAHKKGATKTTYRPSPSEETRAERERRLYRECRGMPNAGACKGFTRR